MQVSVIKYGNLERTKRLDSEYYNPKYLNSQAILNNKETVSISDVCKVSDGNHMSISSHFQEHSGIPYYRGQDINTDFFIENAQPIYIPEEVYEQSFMKRSIFKTGDVLLSIVGTIGSLSLVTEKIQKSTGSCKLAILRPEKVCSEYLATFLMCFYGKQQVKRSTRGAVQMGLILEDMDQIQIWLAPEEFQRKISEVIQSSLEKNRKIKSYFTQAQTLLLSEFGLSDWKPKHYLSYVKKYSETQQTGRFDAEYYQPKYDEIVDILVNEYNAKPIGDYDIFDITTGQYSEEYVESDEGAPYIRGTDLINGSVDIDNLLYIPIKSQIEDKKAKEGDVVVTRVGSIGLSARVPKECEGGTISDNLIRIRISDETKINTYYLAAFLNSIVGKELMLRNGRGSVQQRLNQETLKEIVFPILPFKKQLFIAEKVTESFNLRKQSKHLLECAKKAVEMAIETDEETAIQWLESQINSIERGN